MKAFLIDTDNNVTAYPAQAEAARASTDGAIVCCRLEDLQHDTASWPTSRLVDLWNTLPGVVAVKKFTDRQTALRRIWKAIQSLQPALPSAPAAVQPRDGTKKALVLRLLEQPDGATVQELTTAVGWQAHSVRGFLSKLNKEGAAIRCFERAPGKRAYALNSGGAPKQEGN